jgi:tripartite ATP-independent transporter DctM subunit
MTAPPSHAAGPSHPAGGEPGVAARRWSFAGWLGGLTAAVGALTLAANVALVFLSVIWRYALHDPLEWAEEVARALMVTLVFAGAATAMARGSHIGVELFNHAFPRRVQEYVVRLNRWVMVGVSGGLAWASYELLVASFVQTTPTGLPQAIYVAPVLFGAVVMSLSALEHAVAPPRRIAFQAGAAALAVVATVSVLVHGSPDLLPSGGTRLIAVFLLGLLAGLPIGFTLGASALSYFVLDANLPVMFFAQQVAAGVDHFVLLAVPFFLLAGAAMEVNGMSTRLVELIVRGLGRFRGGLNLTIVTSMAFFSGISGSKLADVAAVGGVIMPAARRARQAPDDVAGLLAASAVMAETIPPCINMIIMGFVANISIGALFVAGLVPAAILALALCVTGWWFGSAIDVDRAYPSRMPTRQLIIGSLVGLAMILMIGKGVVSGIATSTEISSFAVVYALVVGGLAFRELTWRAVIRLFVDTATMAGTLLFILAMASGVSYALTLELIPQRVAETLIEIGHSHGAWLFVLLSIVIVTLFGAVLEGAAALIIFGPILVPIAQQLGFDPLHYASILIIAMGLGFFAPPIGLGLYTTCVVCGVTMRSVFLPMQKYLLSVVVALVLIALLPSLTLWLPRRFGY